MPPRLVRHQRPNVVIAGGGVAGLEALLALHALAGHVAELTLLSPEREFLYRPLTIAEAFGRGQARSYDITRLVADTPGLRGVWDSLDAVLPNEHALVTGSGERLGYDTLVLATGALMRSPFRGAHIFRGRRDVADVRRIVHDCAVGRAKSIAFVLPAKESWPVPLYEVALMTASQLRAEGVLDPQLSLITPEHEPLELFGTAASDAIADLLSSRGIKLRRDALAVRVEAGALVLASGERVEADRVMTLPVLEGRRIRGLPHDQSGFIPVDDHGRVEGLADVFAAGDATTFPIKQGGLAAQQADAIAEAIAADLGAAVTPRRFTPVLRGMLLTGDSPVYLRYEPEGDGSSAATDAEPDRGSVASDQALWWPPEKVAGRYLAPYLATGRLSVASDELADRAPVPGAPISDAELHEAIDLSLVMADADAGCGDYASALHALDTAAALAGVLPPEFEAKRRAWSAAERDPSLAE